MGRRLYGVSSVVAVGCLLVLCDAGQSQGPFQGPQEVTNTSWEDQVNKSKVNIDAVANEIFPYIVEGSSELDVSVDCMTALLKTFKAFRDLKGWAVRRECFLFLLPGYSGNMSISYSGCFVPKRKKETDGRKQMYLITYFSQRNSLMLLACHMRCLRNYFFRNSIS